MIEMAYFSLLTFDESDPSKIFWSQ